MRPPTHPSTHNNKPKEKGVRNATHPYPAGYRVTAVKGHLGSERRVDDACGKSSPGQDETARDLRWRTWCVEATPKRWF